MFHIHQFLGWNKYKDFKVKSKISIPYFTNQMHALLVVTELDKTNHNEKILKPISNYLEIGAFIIFIRIWGSKASQDPVTSHRAKLCIQAKPILIF